MADTTPYKKRVEAWFRTEYLPKRHPDGNISVTPVSLVWGGAFQYDATVHQGNALQAVYCLSCSEYKTNTGKGGAGKFNKIQGDILKMVGTDCPHKVLVFTGKTMLQKVRAEQTAGRLPPDIQCELAELPPDLQALVQKISAESAGEVTPPKRPGASLVPGEI